MDACDCARTARSSHPWDVRRAAWWPPRPDSWSDYRVSQRFADAPEIADDGRDLCLESRSDRLDIREIARAAHRLQPPGGFERFAPREDADGPLERMARLRQGVGVSGRNGVIDFQEQRGRVFEKDVDDFRDEL